MYNTEIQLKVDIAYICSYVSVGSVYLSKFRLADRNCISLWIWVFHIIHIWYEWRYISIKLENDWFLGRKISSRSACSFTWAADSLSQTHVTGAGAMQSLRYIKDNLIFFFNESKTNLFPCSKIKYVISKILLLLLSAESKFYI